LEITEWCEVIEKLISSKRLENEVC